MSGIYSRGGEDIEAEQLAREAVIEALPRRAAPHLRTLHFRAHNPALARPGGNGCSPGRQIRYNAVTPRTVNFLRIPCRHSSHSAVCLRFRATGRHPQAHSRRVRPRLCPIGGRAGRFGRQTKESHAVIDRPRPSAMKALVFHVQRIASACAADSTHPRKQSITSSLRCSDGAARRHRSGNSLPRARRWQPGARGRRKPIHAMGVTRGGSLVSKWTARGAVPGLGHS